MASRKGSRIGWRWVAVGATLVAGVAIFGGRRMSGRTRRAMRRDRGSTGFPGPQGTSPAARETASKGGPKSAL